MKLFSLKIIILIIFLSSSLFSSCYQKVNYSNVDDDCTECYYTKRYPPHIGCRNAKGQIVSFITTAHNPNPKMKSSNPIIESCNSSESGSITYNTTYSINNIIGDGTYVGTYDKLNPKWHNVYFLSTSQEKFTDSSCEAASYLTGGIFTATCGILTKNIICLLPAYALLKSTKFFCKKITSSKKSCGYTSY